MAAEKGVQWRGGQMIGSARTAGGGGGGGLDQRMPLLLLPRAVPVSLHCTTLAGADAAINQRCTEMDARTAMTRRSTNTMAIGQATAVADRKKRTSRSQQLPQFTHFETYRIHFTTIHCCVRL